MSKAFLFLIRPASAALLALFALVYWMTLLALGFRSRIVVGTIFMIILVITILAVLLKQNQIGFGKYSILLSLLVLVSVLFLSNYQDVTIFVTYVNYFLPVVYFAMFSILFVPQRVNQDISRFFRAVFAVETTFILIEIFDDLVGFDVHQTWIVNFFIVADNRFEQHVDITGTGLTTIQALPVALGLHGFPHYTAPIYVVCFAFAIAHAFSPSRLGGRLRQSQRLKAVLTLFVGVFCIYILGVKTHFVTTIAVLLIIGFTVSRKVFSYSAVAAVLLTIGTLQSSWAMERIENLTDQVFIGNEVEGSRLEVIFKFEEYDALLNLSPWAMIAGSGEFSALAAFEDRGYFFEQKILVYAVVLGVPYVLLLLGFFGTGFYSCSRVYRFATDAKMRANGVAIGCGLLTYLLDLGHFGYTMITPNLQLVFVMLAAVCVIEKALPARTQHERLAPGKVQTYYPPVLTRDSSHYR